MLTISKPLSSTQAQTYHTKEFTAAEQNYWKQEHLEAEHSDALTAYLNAMSRFHNYSFGNILEIARQRAATYCSPWVLAPMPTASASRIVMSKPGDLRKRRRASFKSAGGIQAGATVKGRGSVSPQELDCRTCEGQPHMPGFERDSPGA